MSQWSNKYVSFKNWFFRNRRPLTFRTVIEVVHEAGRGCRDVTVIVCDVRMYIRENRKTGPMCPRVCVYLCGWCLWPGERARSRGPVCIVIVVYFVITVQRPLRLALRSESSILTVKIDDTLRLATRCVIIIIVVLVFGY